MYSLMSKYKNANQCHLSSLSLWLWKLFRVVFYML